MAFFIDRIDDKSEFIRAIEVVAHRNFKMFTVNVVAQEACELAAMVAWKMADVKPVDERECKLLEAIQFSVTNRDKSRSSSFFVILQDEDYIATVPKASGPMFLAWGQNAVGSKAICIMPDSPAFLEGRLAVQFTR